jgi:hypothetical protein
MGIFETKETPVLEAFARIAELVGLLLDSHAG